MGMRLGWEQGQRGYRGWVLSMGVLGAGGGVPNVPPAAPLSPGWTGRTCPTRAAWSTSGTCVTSSGSPPTPKTPGSAGRPATGSWATCGAARTPRRRLGPPHPNPHPSPLSIHPSSLGVHPLFFSPQVPDVGLRDELPSDESLSESGTAQHFAGKLPSPGGIPWVFLGLLLIPHTFLCPHSVRLPDADPGQRHRDLPTPGLWRGPREEHPKTPRAPGAAARCGAGEAGSPHQSAPEGSDPGTGGAQRGGAAGARQTPRHWGPLPRHRPPRRSQPPGLSPRCVSQRVTRGRGGRVRPPLMLQGAHRCGGESLIIWGGGWFCWY